MLENISRQISKEKLLEEQLRKVEGRLDKIGGEMDPEIIKTVAILNLLNIPTSGSCSGHLDHGLRNPWVNVQQGNRPGERFNNEKAVKESIAQEFDIPWDEVGYSDNEFANNKFWNFIDSAEETAEYKDWQEENQKLETILLNFINEFYSIGKPIESVAVQLIPVGGLAGRLQAGVSEENLESIDQDRGLVLAEELKNRQDEMRRFTDFLKEKFIQGA